MLAGVLALALLALGALIIWGQASQDEFDARRTARIALVPDDLFDVGGAVAAATPEGWHAATLMATVTDRGPVLMTLRRVLFGGSSVIWSFQKPADYARGSALRGIIVVDCAGSERLEVVARGFVAPAALATSPCRPERQVVAIDIPGSVLQREQTAVKVAYVDVTPIDEGPTGGMNRALLVVARAGTPDPDRDALIATFVAAFGTDDPR